ncbi:MAG: polysaccharide deacetylase family protein, partial [Candidatus Asgardarchaeia archaeon]
WETNYTMAYGNLTQVNRENKEWDPIINITNWGYDFVGFFNYSYPHYVVSWILDGDVKTPAILASEVGKGRVSIVTLTPYHPFVDNTPIIVYLIRWLVFGDRTQAFLLLSPGRVMPILALDADLTAIYSVANLSIRRALNLSRTLGLKFTWAFVTGPFNGIPDWELLKPLIREINSTGNEIASHSRTHPTWADYEDDTDRVVYELKGSYDDLVGNLSMEIYAFHTPDGKFYEKWYPIASEYYEYIATIPIWTSHHVFGFYFFKNVSEDFAIFYRSSYSDYYYFEYNPIPFEDAIEFECENYDEFYKYGYSVPYVYLWHDYSFANDTRFYGMIEPTISHFMSYEDIYPSTLLELWRRMVAWRRIRFDLTYGQDLIEVHVDTSAVPKKFMNYVSGMTLTFEGNNRPISEVYVDGERYLAFSNDSIILPKVTDDEVNLTVVFGTCETPHLSFTNLVVGKTSMENKVLRLQLLNIFGGALSKVVVEMPKKPKVVVVNGSLYDDWVYDDGKVLMSLNTEGVKSYYVEICYGEPVIVTVKTSHPIGKYENASIEGVMIARLEGVEVPSNLTLYLEKRLKETIKTYSYIVNVTIVNGEFTLKLKPPDGGWDEGIYSASLTLMYGEDESYTVHEDYVFSVCENKAFYSLERSLSFYSLLFVILLLSYLRYKRRI